jgi:PHD/YefM family antitoxin component YafN of YafNO toxin-antitoxin module
MSNAALEKIQYVSDQNGNLTGVFLPIEVWRELESELETRYLLQSEAMRERLLEARKRDEGIPLEEALEKLGI